MRVMRHFVVFGSDFTPAKGDHLKTVFCPCLGERRAAAFSEQDGILSTINC
jgi:hypothetical protein